MHALWRACCLLTCRVSSVFSAPSYGRPMSRGIFGDLFRIEDIETHLKDQSGGSLPDCLHLSAASMSESLSDLHIALNTAGCLPFRGFSDGVLVFGIRGLLRFRLGMDSQLSPLLVWLACLACLSGPFFSSKFTRLWVSEQAMRKDSKCANVLG